MQGKNLRLKYGANREYLLSEEVVLYNLTLSRATQ